MIIAILIIACLILIALIFGLYVLNNKKDPSSEMALDSIKKLENSITVISTRLDEMDKSNFKLNQLVDSRLGQYSNDSNKLVTTIENKLADIQKTVDEKLQTTLESRISSSFKQVGERLESVYKQLGEMQNLSQGVGNLQRVLTNVKTRGIWGELQAERILQEILVPEQYEKNVVTKKGSRDAVEFAIKLPGSLEGQCVYLPIDSKFPREDYEKLCMATEEADTEQIKNLKRALERRIVLEAQTIRDKYIDVPNTTDFAVMFLPIEGLYAEVLSIA
ncbi:MAG: DNA recombination protein RmuC, partial [Sphaerochaetaceae bacterium]|nr:DNA recombination protein RmuC [Sphaerochaetaceae bacterium]